MIRNLLLAALGGAVGSVLRYLIFSLNTSFPWSTFANESFGMMKAGDALQMALYVAVSVIVGIMAVWSGMVLSNHLIDLKTDRISVQSLREFKEMSVMYN